MFYMSWLVSALGGNHDLTGGGDFNADQINTFVIFRTCIAHSMPHPPDKADKEKNIGCRGDFLVSEVGALRRSVPIKASLCVFNLFDDRLRIVLSRRPGTRTIAVYGWRRAPTVVSSESRSISSSLAAHEIPRSTSSR